MMERSKKCVIALPCIGYTSSFHVLDVLEHKLDGIDRWLTRNEDHWNVSSEIRAHRRRRRCKKIDQSLRTAWRVGLAIRYVISHSTRISDFWIMRTMWAQHTKPLLFPRPLYGSKLFRNLLFQVLLYYLAIT
jgi:hypothetical protein